MHKRSLADLYKTPKPERITPPAKKLVKQQANKLPSGGVGASAPGRILSEAAVAKEQGARRGVKPKP